MNTTLNALSSDLADSVASARESLVKVDNHSRGMRASGGAGVIIREDGLILTNAHVVHSSKLTVTLPDGESLPARILARDKKLDLALLQVEADKLSAITISESKSHHAGEIVTAVGHPWGVEGAATFGVLIGGRTLPENRSKDENWLPASLHLRPGHSGGPLVDAQGHLVGINAMMAGPNVGIAVAVDVVESFIEQTIKRLDAQEDQPFEEAESPTLI